MTRPTKILWITVIVTVLVTAAAMLLALFAAGVGHGTYLPAAALFPFGTARAGAAREAYYDPLALALVFLQFPAYGFFVGRAWLRDRQLPVAFAVFILHAVAAIACIFWMRR